MTITNIMDQHIGLFIPQTERISPAYSINIKISLLFVNLHENWHMCVFFMEKTLMTFLNGIDGAVIELTTEENRNMSTRLIIYHYKTYIIRNEKQSILI